MRYLLLIDDAQMFNVQTSSNDHTEALKIKFNKTMSELYSLRRTAKLFLPSIHSRVTSFAPITHRFRRLATQIPNNEQLFRDVYIYM